MNKLFLLLLMFVPSIVFGQSYNDEWPIYVYGDANYYKVIYDAMAMIALNHVFMDDVYRLVFIFSLLYATYSFGTANLKGGLYNTAAGVGIVTMLLYPSSTVHIVDVRTLHGFVYPVNQGTGDYAGYAKADNVPFYLAALPSFATALKYYIIDAATDALTPISGGSFRDSGFATPMTLADDMIGVASFKYSKDDQYIAPKFEQALSHYIEKCIINEAIYIDKSTIFGVMDPKGQQIDALKPSNFSSMNLANTDIQDLRGVDTTCGAFWNNEIATKTATIGGVLLQNLQDKNPKINVVAMADSVSYIAGIETNASIGSVTLTNAMLNIATTATLLNTFTKAGAGLSGIDLSNSVTAKQSLTANMTDSTGQFKWMIRVIPVLEFLIFGILIFLGFLMGIFAGFVSAEKGSKMILNYASGLIAFAFIDVALAIVQAVSLYYYNTKMMDAMIMFGQNPFTATNIPVYIQEAGYMSGIMGMAAMFVVPITVAVVFKGETMAAMGAYNSVMGKYKGDGGGQNLGNSLGNSAAVHEAEAKEYEESARRELLGGYGLTAPHGVLASEMLARVSAEAAGYGGNLGANRVADKEFGSNQDYIGARIEAGMGSGVQKISAELGAGRGLMRTINEDPSSVHNFMEQSGNEASAGFSATAKKGELASQPDSVVSRENQIEAAKGNAESDLRKTVASGLGASKAFKDGFGDDFSYQAQTDAEAGINATAAKGKFSKDNAEFNRDEQVKAAMVMANDGLVKGVQNAKGMVGSMGFDEHGNVDNEGQFDKYASGSEIQSRIAANKVMGAGIWAEGKTEKETIDAMSDIQRVGAMGVASEVAKGDAFQKSNYGGNLDKFEADSMDIEKSKSDSMFGQAKGVRDNYKVNEDMYSQNAEYSEESKQQSTNAKIATQSGIAGAVATDVADASIKALQQIGSTSGMMQVAENLAGQQEFINKTLAGARNAEHRKQMLKDFENSGWTDAEGNVQEGAFIKARAMLGANNMMSSNSMGIGGSVVSGTIGATSDNTTVKVDGVNSASSGTTKSTDNSTKLDDSIDIKTSGKFKEQVVAFQASNSGRAPKDLKELSQFVEKSDMAEEAKNSFFGNAVAAIADNTGLSTEAVVASGALMGAYGLNKMTGNPIGKTYDGLKESGANLRDRLFGVSENQATEKTENSSNDKHDSKGSDNHTKHDNSPNSDKDNISNNAKTVKDEVGEQYKKEQVLNGDANYNKDMDALKDRQASEKALNPNNTNVDSRHNMEKAAMEDAHYQRISEANLSAPSEKGFFGKRMEALGEAMHSGAGWKSKLGMAAAAITLGEVSATAGEIMQVFDPISQLSGTEAGSSAFGGDELKQMMAARHQGAFTQPSGFNTSQAIQQDQMTQSATTSARNLETINSLNPSRNGGFTMSDSNGQQVSFTTDKSAGYPLMMNGQNTGMSYQNFSSMMQNGEMASQFSNALSSSDMSNKDAYNTTNKLLQDMSMQSRTADRKQMIHNNASDTNRSMQHKEMLEASGTNKDEEV